MAREHRCLGSIEEFVRLHPARADQVETVVVQDLAF
jgi:hypothetical protein